MSWQLLSPVASAEKQVHLLLSWGEAERQWNGILTDPLSLQGKGPGPWGADDRDPPLLLRSTTVSSSSTPLLAGAHTSPRRKQAYCIMAEQIWQKKDNLKQSCLQNRNNYARGPDQMTSYNPFQFKIQDSVIVKSEWRNRETTSNKEKPRLSDLASAMTVLFLMILQACPHTQPT